MPSWPDGSAPSRRNRHRQGSSFRNSREHSLAEPLVKTLSATSGDFFPSLLRYRRTYFSPVVSYAIDHATFSCHVTRHSQKFGSPISVGLVHSKPSRENQTSD